MSQEVVFRLHTQGLSVPEGAVRGISATSLDVSPYSFLLGVHKWVWTWGGLCKPNMVAETPRFQPSCLGSGTSCATNELYDI